MTLTTEIMIGIGIGTGIGSILTYFSLLKLTSKIERALQAELVENRHEMVIAFRYRIHEILSDAVARTTASNALLFHVHNGTNFLTAGGKIYSSVVEEAPSDLLLSAFKEWQQVLVDFPYIELLRRLKDQQSVFLRTQDMPEGLLKMRYEAMGIKGSIVFMVYSGTKGGFYYASYPSTANENDLTSNGDYVTFELNHQALRRVCEEYHDKGILH